MCTTPYIYAGANRGAMPMLTPQVPGQRRTHHRSEFVKFPKVAAAIDDAIAEYVRRNGGGLLDALIESALTAEPEEKPVVEAKEVPKNGD